MDEQGLRAAHYYTSSQRRSLLRSAPATEGKEGDANLTPSQRLWKRRRERWAKWKAQNKQNNSVVTHFPSTGETIYRNPRGRCEDAPCCGCCT